MLTDEEIRKVAKARVGVKVHALVYVAVNAFLAAIWWVTSPTHGMMMTDDGGFWSFWPMLGWGLGLVIHASVVYGGLRWERAEEEKLRREQGKSL